MTIIHGFEIQRREIIGELRTEACLYHHVKSGAELLSLKNDDENKVFGITFRTPPRDSTGVAHILEHSVLCGSRKYPVKEPFVELLKGSLNTFLNAFTYPDRTCYPVASQNLKDFYNLVDVYLDAVFYPRLTPFVFQQEGWHFDMEDRHGPFRYQGIVFSEMKGSYSSPDTMLGQAILQSLFPDHPYRFDAGGHPEQIPNLTFEQFKGFHARYYHPSNSRIYFYGDDPPEERLRRLNDVLDDFEGMQIDSQIFLQAPFATPRRFEFPCIPGEEGEEGPKGMVTVNWVVGETTETELNLSLRLLDYVLLGIPASPLRKSLIDSGLGEDLAGDGLGSELRQMYFSTGLKGVELGNTGQVEAVILETLQSLVRGGIDPNMAEAALNTVEFRFRENNTGSFPRGLAIMLRALSTWIYGGDPLALVKFEVPLEAVKSRVKTEKHFFEALIDRYFLKNAHRSSLVLKPDPQLKEQEEKAEQDRLAGARSALSSVQINRIIEETGELKRRQACPDPPEALASIPRLKPADLEKRNKIVPLSSSVKKGIPLLFHDLFTSGIVYVDLGLNLRVLPESLIPYVPLFGRALLEMGTLAHDFVAFTQRIARDTGGIRPQVFTSVEKNTPRSTAWLFLRGKAMAGRGAQLIDIFKDLLLHVRLDNRQRFRQMVLEEKARQERVLIPSGHQFINLRLRAHLNAADWAAEQMGGISYVFFLRELARAVDENWEKVLDVLEKMRRLLISGNTLILNITLDEKRWTRLEPSVDELLDSLPDQTVEEKEWAWSMPLVFEGLTIPSQVNFVGKGFDLYKAGYRFHGATLVIARYLRTSWLWQQIRVQGGAYGAFCFFDRLSGALCMISYRDPNLLRTIHLFDQGGEFLRQVHLSQEELTKSIIGTIGDLDTHMLPDAKGYLSMLRYLTGESEEERQRMREEVLGTREDHFIAFSRMLDNLRDHGVVKVLGSPGTIQAVASERPGWLRVVKVI